MISDITCISIDCAMVMNVLMEQRFYYPTVDPTIDKIVRVVSIGEDEFSV